METIEETIQGHWRLFTLLPDERIVLTIPVSGRTWPVGGFETMVFGLDKFSDPRYDAEHKTQLAARTYHCELVAGLSK